MSKNCPETIPAPYQSAPLEDAYRRGWNHGHGIACHNVPDLGAKLHLDNMGRVTVDAENIREVHASLCYEAESNSRCYSPFEVTAHEFNQAGNPSDRFDIEEIDGTFDVNDSEGDTVRSFSTRELANAWIDAQPSSEELWEAFEAGTGDAINADLSEYTDELYGIEPETASDE